MYSSCTSLSFDNFLNLGVKHEMDFKYKISQVICLSRHAIDKELINNQHAYRSSVQYYSTSD